MTAQDYILKKIKKQFNKLFGDYDNTGLPVLCIRKDFILEVKASEKSDQEIILFVCDLSGEEFLLNSKITYNLEELSEEYIIQQIIDFVMSQTDQPLNRKTVWRSIYE